MPSKNMLLCLALFVFPLSLKGEAAAAVPVESSHYNSNTFTNLNTLTSTGPITFTIAYDAPGDIKWYKDNALVQTNTSTTTASLTAVWTEGDYGMVRQMRANSTGVDGSSNDTIWNVEVQQTGTAVIAKHTGYPQPRVDGQYTFYVTNGRANLASLYLAAKQPDNLWIEYACAKTYVLKKSVIVSGSETMLEISTDTAREIKLSSDYPIRIIAVDSGTVTIDKVNMYGWNTANNRESLASETSPEIQSNGYNTLSITDSNLRHVEVFYNIDQSSGDIVDNSSFYGGNPYNMRLMDGYGDFSAQGQIITGNYFIDGRENFKNNRSLDARGMVLQGNRFISHASGNIQLGKNTRFIGNEVQYSDWNLIEFPENALAKCNNLHDNGGYHNGFNGMKQAYSVYDYCHDFTGYSCFYIQVVNGGIPDPADWIYPDHGYIFNGYSKDAPAGINIYGGHDFYFYNYGSDNTTNNVQYRSDRIVYRKSRFSGSHSAAMSINDPNSDLLDYGFVSNVYVIDSEFSYTNAMDYKLWSDPANGGNPIFHSINTFRRNADNSITLPSVDISGSNWKGEARNYVYLDVLVQDQNGTPVPDAVITINAADADYPAAKLTLPPPPADLNEVPAEFLPIPGMQSFDSIVTGSDGHTPLPNYGWSASTEATPVIMFARQADGVNNTVTTQDYRYQITANHGSNTVSKDITPDVSWLREDPCQPAKTVVLTFDQPAGKYALNVNGGTGSGLYDQGQSVAISAGAAPAGKVFDKWIGDTTTVNNVNSASTYVVVPSSDVSVTAYFKDITYHLTVVGGTGSGDYPAGRIVIVDAEATNGAQVFYKWTGDTEHVVSPAVYSSTLIMPAHDVTVTATYRNPTSYSCRLTVAEGEGTDFYAPGDNVTITAATAPSGKVFDHWEGDTASLADAGSGNTTLTGMPDDYLIVYPVYRASGLPSGDANLSNLTVSGGTLLPRFSSYASGYAGIVGNSVASVTVTPTASQGTRAAITVNGRTVNSGSASGPITLNATGSTLITVVVTAPDTTTTRTYTISVTRTPLATGYTLTAPNPASGEVGAASGNFTVTPNGKYTGTITITPAGGGLSTPLNVTFSNSDEARTFTITPAAAGTVTLTPGNSGGLADPAAVTYTAYMPGTLRNACRSYPNPADFSKVSRTTIVYTVASESAATIRIYTIAGELVKTLVNNETRAAGEYTVDWQGDTESGRKAASGIYFCVTSIGNDIIKKKIAIIR